MSIDLDQNIKPVKLCNNYRVANEPGWEPGSAYLISFTKLTDLILAMHSVPGMSHAATTCSYYQSESARRSQRAGVTRGVPALPVPLWSSRVPAEYDSRSAMRGTAASPSLASNLWPLKSGQRLAVSTRARSTCTIPTATCSTSRNCYAHINEPILRATSEQAPSSAV